MQNLRAEARTSRNQERLQYLARANRYLAREVLRNPEASGTLLKELFDKHHDPTTRELIIKHPNCSVELLSNMGGQYPSALQRNPALPLLLLEDPNFFDKLNKYSMATSLTSAPLSPAFI